jgi:MATE family multidrug resistance protein
MLSLAGPVIVAEIGWISMGIVDTIMVGRIGPSAIGAVSIGSVLFFTVAIFGMGLLLGLDALVSQAFGAGRLDECHRWLLHGIYLSLMLVMPLMALVRLNGQLLPIWGIHPEVLRQAIPYQVAVNWSMLPLLLYASFRRYLQAINLTKPVMFALVTANLVNIAGNWVLIFGHFGFPAMGAEGAGWATCLSRVYMAAVLLGFILYHDSRHKTGLLGISFKMDKGRMKRLLGLGFPAASQITMEVGVFAVATTLAGKLEPTSLAAHQIALNVASFTFMVPLGVASAGAVRVGQAVGRLDHGGVSRSGWAALSIGALFMSCASLAFLLLPKPILKIFTTNPSVIATGVSLLFVAALFQLFDGLQVVATGVMRGTGDTRTPMICNLVGHWMVGLPIGYFLCFAWNWDIIGLWTGLSAGLIAVGVVLVYLWARRLEVLLEQLCPRENRC